jgi:hypothetical protein
MLGILDRFALGMGVGVLVLHHAARALTDEDTVRDENGTVRLIAR